MTTGPHEHTADMISLLARGIVGVGASLLGMITTFQTQLEFWLRITLTGASIGVAALTAYSLVLTIRKRKRDLKEDDDA